MIRNLALVKRGELFVSAVVAYGGLLGLYIVGVFALWAAFCVVSIVKLHPMLTLSAIGLVSPGYLGAELCKEYL